MPLSPHATFDGVSGPVRLRLVGRLQLCLLLAAWGLSVGCKEQPEGSETAETYLDLRGSTLRHGLQVLRCVSAAERVAGRV